MEKMITKSIFLDKRFEEYNCVRCDEVSLNLYQTSCGHRLCEKCYLILIDEIAKNGPQPCPAKEDICETLENNEAIVHDFAARKDLNRMKVKCLNHIYGCTVQLLLKSLWDHLEKHCEFVPTDCEYSKNGCDFKGTKAQVQEHAESCGYRLQFCKFCGQAFAAKLLFNHETKECLEANIKCPYGCMTPETIKRKELPIHLQSCPFKPLPCSFARFGCKFEARKEEMLQHIESEQSAHLSFLLNYVGALEKEIKQLKSKADETRFMTVSVTDKCKSLQQDHLGFKSSVIRTSLDLRTAQDHIQTLQQSFDERKKMVDGSLSALQTLINSMDRTVPATGGSSAGAASVLGLAEDQLNSQLIHQTVKLEQFDLRMKVIETTSYAGGIVWKIDGYSKRKEEACKEEIVSIYSAPFYTSRYGYKMCGRVYLNGDGAAARNTHLSAFFVIMRGQYDNLNKWPFNHKVTVVLMDQEDGSRDVKYSFTPKPEDASQNFSFVKPQNEMNVASGCQKFVEHRVIEDSASPYLKDDTLFLKIQVDKSNLRDPYERD